MKKIVIVFMTILLASCSDFLDLPKLNEASSGTYFKNVSDFEQMLIGTYQQLRTVYGVSGFVMGEMRSDNAHYEYYPKVGGAEIQDRQFTCDFIDGNDNVCSNRLWNACYVGISRANIIISRMNNTVDEAMQKQILSEAKFLRALYYFNLVRFFGSVPLHDKEVSSPSEASTAKAPVTDIYALIVSDLEYAINGLKPVSTFPQSGRITQGAAYTLLGSVYLYQKQFDKALAALNEVKGYKLLDTYAAVFSTSNKNSQESIFEVQYKEGTEGQHSDYLYYMLPKAQNNVAILGIPNSNNVLDGGNNVPTKDVLRTYESGDQRLNATIGVVEGVIQGDEFVSMEVKEAGSYVPDENILYRYFCRKYMNPHSIVWQTADNWPVFRYSDVLLMRAECLNETGQSSQALTPLNMVRTRAGLGGSPIIETNQSKLRDIILHERRVELAFENHRWHDLVRTGNAISVMTTHGKEMKATYPYLNKDSYNITEVRLTYPIPYYETVWNLEL